MSHNKGAPRQERPNHELSSRHHTTPGDRPDTTQPGTYGPDDDGSPDGAFAGVTPCPLPEVERMISRGRPAAAGRAGDDAEDDEHQGATLPRYPIDVLPPIFQELLTAFAAATSVPVELAVMPMLAVMSYCLGPHWRVNAQGFVGSPRLWFAPVAVSGATKTPTTRPILAPLWEEHWRLERAYKAELAEWKMADGDDRSEKPRQESVVTTLLTVEGLRQALDVRERGVFIDFDELAQFFADMDGYSGSRRGGRPFMLSLWSGTSFSEVRKGAETSSARDPYAVILGGVQPSTLSKLELADGDGMCARFLWSFAPVKIGGLGQQLDDNTVTTWAKAVKLGLEHQVSDEQLAEEGAIVFIDALLRDTKTAAAELDQAGAGLLSSMYGKAGTHLMGLTALLHGMDAIARVLEGEDTALTARPVPLATVQRAAEILNYTLAHGRAAVSSVLSRPVAESIADDSTLR